MGQIKKNAKNRLTFAQSDRSWQNSCPSLGSWVKTREKKKISIVVEKESNAGPLIKRSTTYRDTIASSDSVGELQCFDYWSSNFDNGMQDE